MKGHIYLIPTTSENTFIDTETFTVIPEEVAQCSDTRKLDYVLFTALARTPNHLFEATGFASHCARSAAGCELYIIRFL